jgi:hypothetical protein
MKPPLFSQRFALPFKAVLIQCLDHSREPIKNAFASGFIRQEGHEFFLYTCWHVATGFDPNDVRVGLTLPSRGFFQVSMQDAQQRQPGTTAIGGLQTIVLPLYDTSYAPARPLWLQDAQDVPHPDLNAINLRIPFWHDAVKLKLPSELRISDMQLVTETGAFRPNLSLVAPGEKVMVVGYPYGFSVVGADQPTPVVLTRHIAGTRIVNRRRELLLESFGAPGMSGGPVFIERDDDLLLLGVYTGLIYPDVGSQSNEKVTALGTVVDMSICWGDLPLVQQPNAN